MGSFFWLFLRTHHLCICQDVALGNPLLLQGGKAIVQTEHGLEAHGAATSHRAQQEDSAQASAGAEGVPGSDSNGPCGAGADGTALAAAGIKGASPQTSQQTRKRPTLTSAWQTASHLGHACSGAQPADSNADAGASSSCRQLPEPRTLPALGALEGASKESNGKQAPAYKKLAVPRLKRLRTGVPHAPQLAGPASSMQLHCLLCCVLWCRWPEQPNACTQQRLCQWPRAPEKRVSAF